MIESATLVQGKRDVEVSYADALENYQRNTDWWVVFAAFDLPDFKPSPLWISERTSLSIETVAEALEGLVTLGHLKKEKGAFYPIQGKHFVELDIQSKQKADVLDIHSLISHQILNHLEPQALVAVDHRCFASNLDILQELYSDISKAFEKAYANSKSVESKDRIFKMSFTAVDVLKGKVR